MYGSSTYLFKNIYSLDLFDKNIIDFTSSKQVLAFFYNFNYVTISFSLKSITKKSKRSFVSGSLFLESWSGGSISKIRIIKLKRKANKPIRFCIKLELHKNIDWSISLKNLIFKLRRKNFLIYPIFCNKLSKDFDLTKDRPAYRLTFKKLLHAIDSISKEIPFNRLFEEQSYHYIISFWGATSPIMDNLLLSYHRFPVF